MTTTTSHSEMTPIGELARWNKARFAGCIAYMSKRLGLPLSTYDAAKLHVLADYFHVVETGRPVIGGKLRKYQHGPVVRDTLEEVKKWPEASSKPKRYRSPETMDLSTISPSEMAALDFAVETMKSLNTPEKQHRYFHTNASALGYAWRRADDAGKSVMNWIDVLNKHEALSGKSVEHIKALIQMWGS